MSRRSFWIEMAAGYLTSAAAIWMLSGRAVTRQEVIDCIFWVPAMAALGAYLRWRKGKNVSATLQAAAAWGLIGAALACVFLFVMPALR